MTLLVMTLFASVACGSSRWMSLPQPSSFDHSDRQCYFMGSGFGFLTGRYAVRNHSRVLAQVLVAVGMTSGWPSAEFWLVSRRRQPFHKPDYGIGI
jgi:hypothetical protein